MTKGLLQILVGKGVRRKWAVSSSAAEGTAHAVWRGPAGSISPYRLRDCPGVSVCRSRRRPCHSPEHNYGFGRLKRAAGAHRAHDDGGGVGSGDEEDGSQDHRQHSQSESDDLGCPKFDEHGVEGTVKGDGG